MTKRDQFLATAARMVDVALATGGVLASLVFFYFFYYYGLTAQRHFTSSVYIGVYYALPLALAVCLFASLRLSAVQKVNLFLVLAASCASVYTLELFMEWRIPSFYAATTPVMTLLADSNDRRRDAANLRERWGVDIDWRTADEAILDLRKGGVDPVPIMTPSNHLFMRQPDGSIKSAIKIDGDEVMPLGAVSNRVTLLCSENGQWIQYKSDGRGFNNADDIWQLDRLEIAALGDSFAQGYCVPPAENFVALIRRQYPATLNLGMAGNGPLLMLATLKEYLPRFKPKIVLWFYFEGNDLGELQNEKTSALLSRYLTDGFVQRPLARQSDIDRAIIAEMPRLRTLNENRRARRLSGDRRVVGELVAFAKLSTLRQRVGLVGGVDGGEMAPLGPANMSAFREVLLQAKARVDQWGGQLVFVYLPDWARYASYTSPEIATRSDVLNLVRDLTIPIVDIHPAFQAHGDPLSLFPFRRNGHYNEVGHRLVAEEVLKALSQKEQLR